MIVIIIVDLILYNSSIKVFLRNVNFIGSGKYGIFVCPPPQVIIKRVKLDYK